MKRIVIELPSDRRKQGSLRLYDGERLLISDVVCLGKSDGMRAARANNIFRTTTKIKGDTPLGSYTSPGVTPAFVFGIGDTWIPIQPTAGDALVGYNNGRRGLAIHGGRGNDRLMPTEGCVRLYDLDFKALASLLDGEAVEVEIVQREESDPRSG